MNPEQETAYADMVEGKSLFITGGGGVGKSYLIKKFYENNKFGTFMTSTTGISALDIGGQTLYSFLGIGEQVTLYFLRLLNLHIPPSYLLENGTGLKVRLQTKLGY